MDTDIFTATWRNLRMDPKIICRHRAQRAGSEIGAPTESQSRLTSAAAYHEIRHVWKSGDVIDLDLQMETELIEANPLVEETLGQVAVKRGPMVYCLESVDLPPGVKPLDVLLSPDIKLRARYDQRLLGGVAVLEGTALARTNANWSGELYRELHLTKPTPLKLRLIPYSVWANRGASEMSVWLPLAHP